MKRINYLNIVLLTVLIYNADIAYGQVFDKEPDKKLLTISKTFKDSVRANPEKFLPLLTEKLTSDISDPFKRVKIIHDWITTEIMYDTEPYLKYSDLIADTYEVLSYNRAICVGYCNLFNKMCSYANIESFSIIGVAKPSYITAEFLPEKFEKTNHMWSGVDINNKRYLIDLTWDAGFTYKGKFTFNYSTDYLFADPKIFITHHYPEDEDWQLLKDPVSWTEFRHTEFEEQRDKLILPKNTFRGGVSFSRLFNLNIPDINETTGLNMSFSLNKGITNALALELEFIFDHLNIDQDLRSLQSSPYFSKVQSVLTDPVMGVSYTVGTFSFEKIGVGLNLKYHLLNETSLLPFLKTGLSISTPFSFSNNEKGIITRDYGGNYTLYKVKSLELLDQLLYGVLISAGADLVKKERSKNQFYPVLGIELRWSYLLNSLKLIENYDEGQSRFKSFSINLMFYP